MEIRRWPTVENVSHLAEEEKHLFYGSLFRRHRLLTIKTGTDSPLEASVMSMSIDIELKKTSPWHYVTGTFVLIAGYLGLLLAIAWLRH